MPRPKRGEVWNVGFLRDDDPKDPTILVVSIHNA